MLRYLQTLLLSLFLATFSGQASAMFIQPDWFDPTQPGVGANRYSYSGNDPVNRYDPNGNAAVYSDSDGDGVNETRTYFSPTTEIGGDLARGESSSYYAWKGDWGGIRFGISAEGYRDASWTGGGFRFPSDSGNLTLSFGSVVDDFHKTKTMEMGLVALGIASSLYAMENVTPINRNRVTIAVLVAGTDAANVIYAKNGINPSFKEVQRRFVDEIKFLTALDRVNLRNASSVKVPGNHAETKTLEYAHSYSLQPFAIGSSRPFCSNCALDIERQGGKILGPRARFAFWP